MRLLAQLLAGALALSGTGLIERLPSQPAGELGFALPPGYVEQRSGGMVVLTPAAFSEQTPCVYGIAPTRPATGNLDADAEAALLQAVVPGWRRLDDRHAAMRGVAAAGWPYVWYRAAFEGELGGQRGAVNAMAMVLAAGQGRVHVVWGMGRISDCLLDDVPFEQLFHSLRPAGWASDGGQALTRALLGTWRYTASHAQQHLTFKTDGRFERVLTTRGFDGYLDSRNATVTRGGFTLRDAVLTLVPDNRPQNPDRYRVRLLDEGALGGGNRVIALLDDAAKPPRVMSYYRFDERAR